MSELDFDELDKAVNNLMSGVPKVEPPKNDDIKTLDIDAKLPESSRPPLDELNDALKAVNGPVKTETTAVETPAAPSSSAPAAGSLATRRSGRFMDVVHPSSDMKNTMPKPITTRQGVTIEPTSKNLEQAPVSATTETPAPKENDDLSAVSQAEAEPAPAVNEHDSAPAHSEWPDPLEMSGYQPEADTKVPTDEKTEIQPAANDEDDDDDDVFSLDDIEEATPEPLTSPFISDAKVEKRPLGGPTTEPAPVAEPVVTTVAAEEEQAVTTDNPDDQLPATTADVAPILPPELQKDLMAIETDGDTSAQVTESTDEVASTEPAESDIKPEEPTAEPEKVSAEHEKPAVETPVPAGPASIPQQYKEEPSTGDQTNGGIYDTNNYHQPLAHPVKKKSGWLWIVWILLLLIIGGGGAAVLYLFNII